MTVDAYLNGVRLIPGIDYAVSNNQISLSTPPAAGAEVLLVSSGGSRTSLTGNGSTFLYQIDEAWEKENRLTDALQYAYKNKTHPTIADVLERLQVVVELVKNDVTVR